MKFLVFNDNCIFDSFHDKLTCAVDPTKIHAIQRCSCPFDRFPTCYTKIYAQNEEIDTFTDFYEILPHIPNINSFMKLMSPEEGFPVYIDPNAIVSMTKIQRDDGDTDTSIHLLGGCYVVVANSFQYLVKTIEEICNAKHVDA